MPPLRQAWRFRILSLCSAPLRKTQGYPRLAFSAARISPIRISGLDELFADSNFVTIRCPLTNETRGMIGAKYLGSMKRTVYLINTARVGIVDENTLLLRAKQIVQHFR